jgi:hypothetical protein
VQEAERGSSSGKHYALRQQLADQARGRSSHRKPHSDFTAPRGAACHKESGDVRARKDEKQSGNRGQQVHMARISGAVLRLDTDRLLEESPARLYWTGVAGVLQPMPSAASVDDEG